MGRRLRHQPEGAAACEVTDRTVQARFLLRPGPKLNAIVIGCLAKAHQYEPIPIYSFVAMSDHFHLLDGAADVLKRARFMCHFKTNLAKEVGRLHRWRGGIWARRFRPIAVSDEPEVQVERLRYLLENGVKEALVASPRDWPGASSLPALLEGKELVGTWYNRTLEYRARRAGREVRPEDFAETLTLPIEPLPCWAHLGVDERRRRVAEMVHEIEQDAASRHRKAGTRPAGRQAILEKHPHQRPRRPKRSPAPRFHAANPAIWVFFEKQYRWFASLHRDAVEALLRGDPNPRFPIGCFPPALPFVRGSPTPGIA